MFGRIVLFPHNFFHLADFLLLHHSLTKLRCLWRILQTGILLVGRVDDLGRDVYAESCKVLIEEVRLIPQISGLERVVVVRIINCLVSLFQTQQLRDFD